jgi:hypothetical protein
MSNSSVIIDRIMLNMYFYSYIKAQITKKINFFIKLLEILKINSL